MYHVAHILQEKLALLHHRRLGPEVQARAVLPAPLHLADLTVHPAPGRKHLLA